MELIIDVYSHDRADIDNEVISDENAGIIRTCKYCGKKFIGKSKRACRCPRVHYSYCRICGTEFSQEKAISIGNKLSEVCSNKECKNKWSGIRAKQVIKERYGSECIFTTDYFKEKSKQTCLDKFGVEHAAQSEEVKAKLSQSLSSKSDEEKEELVNRRKQTCLERYGVDNPLKYEEFREKSRQTCLEKYGVEYASQSKSFRESFAKTWNDKTEDELNEINQKRIRTSREKYGVDYPCQHPDVRQKLVDSLVNKSDEEKKDIRVRTENTCLERYGATSPAGSEEVQDKMKSTTRERFGVDYIFELPEFRQYLKEWTLEHYGVENPLQAEELKAKGRETSLKKYGYEYANQSPEAKEYLRWNRIYAYADTIEDPHYRDKYLEFVTDPVAYVKNNFDHIPTYNEIYRSIGNRLNAGIYSMLPKSLGLAMPTSSAMEEEIEQFLKRIKPDIHIIRRDHSIITPKEIDLYLPEYSIGIECNPTYTHNSSLPCYSNANPLSRNYHKDKTDLCESKGVFLFHIFGHEWIHNQDVIKSMIMNLIHANNIRYYARNLSVVELSSSESKSFLDQNHRQKGVNCSIKLGLKTSSGELVSVMTFSKMRSTIGKSKSSDDFELVRFCNKVNCSVVGGASKLFKYFLKKYHFNRIVSFSDRAHTRGGLYRTLGFKNISESDPGYVWVNTSNDTYYNRVTCQKQNLRRLFKDETIDIKNKTEQQIMVEHGFVQVFDSGTLTWEYC